MMQLLGYHLVEYLNGTVVGKKHAVSVEDVETIWPIAMEAYERRALRPMLSALAPSMQAYLRAMANSMDDSHVASTGAVAKLLGKTHQQVASARQSLIDEGVIVASGYGLVRFAVPYLRTYLAKPESGEDPSSLLATWDV